MRTHGAHACVHKQAHPCLTWIEWKMKQKRPYDFDNLRSETLHWVIQPKGQSCPLKIRSFGLSSFPSLLSFSFFFSPKTLFCSLSPLSFFLFVTLTHFLPSSPAWGGMNAGGRWLGCFMSQRDRARLIPPPLSLPGGQQGGLKSNWQLAGRELTQGVLRAALIDNCK